VELTWKGYLRILRQSLLAGFDDGFLGTAKAAAYSALLSFFPVLTSAAAILVQTKAEFVSKTISQFLFEVVPPGAEELVRYQFAVKGQRPLLVLVVAALLSVWAASALVGSLLQGFQKAYQIQRGRPILANMGLCMLLVVLSSIPWLAACGLILFGGLIDKLVMRLLAMDPLLEPVTFSWRLFTQLARYGVAFGACVAATMLLYYYGPYRRQRWSGVWRGAVLATLLWMAATVGFGWYVQHLANYNVLYGSVATSIALLVWMYLMSLIALLGCEFNAQYERVTRPMPVNMPSF
jgi:membrane protein